MFTCSQLTRLRRILATCVLATFTMLAACQQGGPPLSAAATAEDTLGTWAFTTRLTADVPTEYAFLGDSVSVSRDTLVVGAWGETDRGRNTGAVYVFDHLDDSWTQRARLTASDAMEGARFGHSVAIDGDTIMVGAIYHGAEGFRSGAVYVFERDGGLWFETDRLTPTDHVPDAYFGSALALHGNTAVVGAPGPNARTAYVFAKSSTGWLEQARLRPAQLVEDARFASSVAIHGDTAVVGAWMDEYDHELDDASVSPSTAFVFERVGDSWVEFSSLTASESMASPQFGYAVAVGDDTIAVSAPGRDAAVYLYERAGPAWTESTRLSARADEGEHFGVSIGLSHDALIVGAPGTGGHAGTAYLYERIGGIWQDQGQILARGAHEDTQLGMAVAMDEKTILIGATGDHGGGTASGAAYAFR